MASSSFPLRLASLALLAAHVPTTLAYLAVSTATAVRAEAACIRCASPRAAFAAYDPPNSEHLLKDALMKRAVHRQMEAFNMVNDRGHQLWLRSSWEAFFSTNEHPSGKLTGFLEELQHSEHTTVFVEQRSFRQGSPDNPFLKKQPSGFDVEIEPPKVAEKLMAVRKDVAGVWTKQLHVIASGVPYPAQPDGQLLAGLATSTAVRAILHDLSMLPSQAHVLEWLSDYLLEHAKEMQPDGDVEAMLTSLAAEPIRIRGAALLDPMDFASQIRERRAEMATKMAQTLEGLVEEDLSIRSNFLEGCFKIRNSEFELDKHKSERPKLDEGDEGDEGDESDGDGDGDGSKNFLEDCFNL